MTISVAVEGAIGSGKTTLAKVLAAHLGAVRLLEDELHNPFLAEFYKGRSAFTCQMCFLEARLEQFAKPRSEGLPVVADHSLEKELLFAGLNLEGEELSLYLRLYERLAPQSGFAPKVVVFLSASVDELMERIRRRGRPVEDGLEGSYLARLVDRYEAWYRGPGSERQRVVVVDADTEHLADDHAAVDRLVEACRAAPVGLSYCNPIV